MVMFQHPLLLPASIKQRTVAIAVDHNPFQFTATPRQQKHLDNAGRGAVHRLMESWLKKKEHYHKDIDYLPAYNQKRVIVDHDTRPFCHLKTTQKDALYLKDCRIKMNTAVATQTHVSRLLG